MISMAATPRRFRCLAAALPLALLLVFMLGPSPVMAEIPGVELSFDDGPDGSNDDTCDDVPPGLDCYPLRNTAAEGPDDEPFDPTGPSLQITFEGNAERTGVNDTDGLYGRAVEFLGGTTDSIRVTSLYSSYNTPDLHAFWALDDPDEGAFWREECRFEVRLNQGDFEIEVWKDGCVESETYSSSVSWPTDTDWHHLAIHRFVDGSNQHKFAVSIDFAQPATTVATIEPPDLLPSNVYFGKGMDGRLDELQAANFAPGPESRFDYDKTYCGKDAAANTTCTEDVAYADGTGLDQFDWDVPVRYKIVYDDTACTSQNPCPVVFALSGGGSCADNYPRQDDLINRLVEGPSPQLAVVAVDPICWAFGFSSYPDEITQMLVVKDALGSLDYLDLTGDYYATGCSHGANNVLEWAVLNEAVLAGDRPARVFVRSPTDHGEHVHCEYHESWCGEKEESFDKVRFGLGTECDLFAPWPHPHSQCVTDFFDDPVRDAFIDEVSTTLAEDYEIGRSWGAAWGGAAYPVCGSGSPSETLCVEEGGFAATDGGRQFRDKWRSVEPENDPTGYFIENDSAHCQHCSLNSDQLDCVVEFLKGGRSGLSQDCLDLDVPGESAADCSAW